MTLGVLLGRGAGAPSGLPPHSAVGIPELDRAPIACDTALVVGSTAELAQAVAALPPGTPIAFAGSVELSRLLAVDPSPQAAVERLAAGRRYPVDLGWVTVSGRRRPFLGSVVTGSAGGGQLAFPWAGRAGVVDVQILEGRHRAGEVRALTVSNLQHWGRWTLSPRSAPNDGRLEVQGFTGSRRHLLRLRRLLPGGLHQPSGSVWRIGGRGATIATPPRWRLSADGVAVGRGAFTVELEPQRATLLI